MRKPIAAISIRTRTAKMMLFAAFMAKHLQGFDEPVLMHGVHLEDKPCDDADEDETD
jgi:hypothetical protein